MKALSQIRPESGIAGPKWIEIMVSEELSGGFQKQASATLPRPARPDRPRAETLRRPAPNPRPAYRLLFGGLAPSRHSTAGQA